MDLIRVERVRRNLTQGDLANLVGVTAGTIRRWEHGGNVPSDKLVDLSRVLDVNVDDLLTYEPVVSSK